MHDLALYLHIAAAIAAVGASATYGIWLNHAAANPTHLSFAVSGVVRIDKAVATPAWLLALVTGGGLVSVEGYSWTAPWILASLAGWLVLLGLDHGLLRPTLRKIDGALGQGSAPAPLVARARTAGVAIGVLGLGQLALMVWKPGS